MLLGWAEPRRSVVLLGYWAIGLLGALLAGLSALALLLVPSRQRYYAIADRVMKYPRWGGLRRGTLPLDESISVRRDQKYSIFLLFREGKRVLVVPADDLASPDGFKAALLANGAREHRGRS
ncbi:MAG: hypothetical protein A3K65_04145 [Euryarchaeota archaeon RBG_16_68_12]|nr:MAG: hypothetical protein A3K65_04145 [Euryarchaeota archaeon RBG_16_68_12]